MARKRNVWGRWRTVLENGVIGAPCPAPSDAEKALIAQQERVTGLEVEPLVLKGGERCPCCGERLADVENERCSSCKNEFFIEVEAQKPGAGPPKALAIEPKPPPPGTCEYRVITQRDEFFKTKFNPEALEELINRYASEGWRVVSMTATDSFFDSFWAKGGGAARQELVVLLERKVAVNEVPSAPVISPDHYSKDMP
jgi:hypothetical protein